MFLFDWSRSSKRIECLFGYYLCAYDCAHYTCHVIEKEFNENEEFTFVGQHLHGKTNNDVTQVKLINCKLSKIPKNLAEKFINLKFLHIEGSEMIKINYFDLSYYQFLEGFTSINNDLIYLPDDLFKDFKKLKLIYFIERKFEFIEPDILTGLNNLMYVTFYDRKYYTFVNIQVSNPFQAQSINRNLHDVFYRKFDSLRELRISEERLRMSNVDLRVSQAELEFQYSSFYNKLINIEKAFPKRIDELKLENSELEKENEELESSISDLKQQIKNLNTSEIALNHQIHQLKTVNGTYKKLQNQLKNPTTIYKVNFKSLKMLTKTSKNLKII
ncbi:hypothetical protein ACKWTF_015282 [Chironomus riparius]